MILAVTPNPALDVTVHAASVHPGAVHRVPESAVRAGGKGLNVARVLHAAGADALALTTAGGATGAEFRAELAAAAVPARLVPVSAPTRRSIAIVDEHSGEVSVFNEFGVAPTLEESAQFWETVRSEGLAASAVAICGSFAPGADLAAWRASITSLAAAGVPLLADTSGPALLEAAASGVAVLKPNRDELLAATGAADVRSGAITLLDGGAALVIVSLGEDGLLLMHRDGRVVTARYPRIVRGNPTGAGDAVVAAALVSIATDPAFAAPNALDVLARRCAAWGAAAVAMPLAGELDPAIAGDLDAVVVAHTTQAARPGTGDHVEPDRGARP